MNHEQPTRDRVLTVARALFAQHGYQGASVRAITKEAEANLGAVTYHFGTKDALYEAVIESLVGPLEARVREVAEGSDPPLDRLDRVVAVLMDHLSRNPDQAAIIQHELARQRKLPARAQRWVAFLFATLTRVIAEGQADGSIVAGTPALLAAAALAQPFYLAMTGPHFAELAGLPGNSILADPETVEHVRRMVRRVLAAPRRDS
jgi:AcrR family transcriptional regulator